MRLYNLFSHLNSRILILGISMLLITPALGAVDSSMQVDHYQQAVKAFGGANYEEALGQFKLAINDRAEQYGGLSKEVANVYSNIGIILKQVGRDKEAIEYYSKAEKIYLQLGEDATSNLATLYINLGYLYIQNGDFNTALTYLENSKNLFFKSKQINSNAYLVLLRNLTTVYAQLNRFEDAFQTAEDLKHLSNNAYTLLTYFETLGFLYLKQGDYKSALKTLIEANRYGEKELGEGFYHEEVILNNMGYCFLNLHQE